MTEVYDFPDQAQANANETARDNADGMPVPIMSEDLRNEEFDEVKYAVPGLIPEGLTILAGKPKMGKSWMALNIACAIACGGKALGGIDVDLGQVMYLALEDNHRRLKKRANIVTGNDIPAGIHFFTNWPRTDKLGLDCLDKYLDDHREVILLIIDTLQKIKPRANSQNTYCDDYDAVGSLQQMAHRHGIAILIVHHLRKMGSDDPMDQISGTLGLTGAADGMLVLTRERGKADAVLHVTGRDIEEDGEFGLQWSKDTATWTIMGPAEGFQPSQERERILQLMREEGPLTNKQIANYLTWSVENVRKITKRMETDGVVKVVSGDRNRGYVYEPIES